jgi:hypothetical protein
MYAQNSTDAAVSNSARGVRVWDTDRPSGSHQLHAQVQTTRACTTHILSRCRHQRGNDGSALGEVLCGRGTSTGAPLDEMITGVWQSRRVVHSSGHRECGELRYCIDEKFPNDFGQKHKAEHMGGPGSGQWYRWNTKSTVQGYRSLDVRQWQREGVLRPHVSFVIFWGDKNGHETASVSVTSGHDRVELSYRYNGDPQRYHIDLTSTPCPYGGRRPWFVCPNIECGRRFAKLYLRGGSFRCRGCHRLAYASQREARCYQPMNRAHKIQQRLGGRPGFINPFPPKPKGMHWRTYERWQ